MIGQSVSHYTILEKLGEGGMGVVYKAHDTKLNRTVALKFLPDRVNQDATAKARFIQEAQAAAALNHPNICTIFSVEESGGSLFMVMEYVEGGTLRGKIPYAKADDAIDVAIQIGEALQEAHGKNIVHRDIKADNIMLTAKGQVKVMDFGLAKLKGALKLTKTSSTVGTLAYMAPEQIQGGEVDHRSDIFSFGVLLFEMVTGELPFRGEHEAAMLYSIVNEEPESVGKYLPDPSPELARILEKALEKNPADRYQTLADLVVDLRRARKQSTKVLRHASRQSVPVMGPEPPGARSPAGKQSLFSKHRWKIAGALAFLIIAGAASLLFLRRSSYEINPEMTIRELEIPFNEIRYHGLSGDGNWTAFPARDPNGNWHVYFMNTAGGEPRVVTTDSLSYILYVDISRDGSKVAFVGFRPGTNGAAYIFVTSALGGVTKVVAKNALSPKWAPDGGRIYYLKVGRRNTVFTDLEIRSVTPEGNDDRKEFTDSITTFGRMSLAVSPDGKSVSWIRSFSNGLYQEVMTRNLASGVERQVTSDKKNVDEVCWASDDRIIFSSNRSGNTNLWMIPVFGGEPVQITKGLGPDLGMHISTDLKKLLYYQASKGNDLRIGSLETGKSRQITFDERAKANPIFSPDGKFIAFISHDPDPLKPGSEIYICNRDGSNRQKIYAGTLSNPAAYMSPDDNRLMYFGEHVKGSSDPVGGKSKTFIAFIQGGDSARFVVNSNGCLWLNRDTLLLYDYPNTWILPLRRGTPYRIFEDSTLAFPTTDRNYMIYWDLRSATGGYWLAGVDGSWHPTGKARRIDNRNDGYQLCFRSPVARELIYWKDGGNLLRVSISDGKAKKVPGVFPNLTRYGFSLDPQTNEFVYAVDRSGGKLVMIENPFK